MKKTDRLLGMDRNITRRDFIHDTGLAALGLTVPSLSMGGETAPVPAVEASACYPPTRTGLRGSHPGSFEIAHALAREGRKWADVSSAGDAVYDLVVVGGGMSGLAAAYFYRQLHGPDVRILILDNHDDFGGHAKRNEFHQGGSMRLAFGGAINLEYTRYSDISVKLLEELGIDFEKLLAASKYELGEVGGLKSSIYFDADSYGRDVLVPGAFVRGSNHAEAVQYIDRFPLSTRARDSLRQFYESDKDVLAGMSSDEISAFMHGTSYYGFLVGVGGLEHEAAQIFMNASHGWYGLTVDNLSVREALEIELPGSHLLGSLPRTVAPSYPSKVAMFPDGNSSVARLLVRALIPAVAAGHGMEDILTAKFNYSQLDLPDSNIRLRLNSTVINAKNLQQGGVEVSYVRNNSAYKVMAKSCVLACYNNFIPFLCPELPDSQKRALSSINKQPMLVSNVLMKNARAANKLGIANAYCPGRLHEVAWLSGPIDLGDYSPGWDPTQPVVMQFFGSPTIGGAGLDGLQASRAGQHRLLAMSFEDFERELRTTLAGMLGAGGFDPAEDILAITVNRWPHGYAYEYLDLYDRDWPEGRAPHEIGRQRFGRISIANSDSGARAYLDSAVDQAWRAVNELSA